MISVTFFYREPRKTGLSIEGIFSAVSNSLRGKAEIKEFYCDPNLSRIKNTLEARKHSNQINHITGDVNFLAIGLYNKKNVLTIHDFGHYENLKRRSRLHFMFYKMFWFVLPIKNIAIITVVSDYTKGKLMEYLGFPAAQIRVVPNPIKPVFQFRKKEKSGDRPRVLQIGSGPHKNLKNLISAAIGTNFHLDIVAYPIEEDLAMLNANKVSYTLYSNLSDTEMYERYIACDVLFFASLHEGFGMPIIEAQAVGRPAVTSNYGAMKEVAKESAILVDPNNVEEIRQAIQKLTTDEKTYNQYVDLGLNNITPYQCDKIADQYLAIYEELAARK